MKKLLFAVSLFAVPAITFGAEISDLLNKFQGILDVLGNIFLALAVLGFFYGLITFIWGGGDVKDKGKNVMLWSLVALFVMFSVWGIINMLQQTAGVDGQNTITPPSIPRLNNN